MLDESIYSSTFYIKVFLKKAFHCSWSLKNVLCLILLKDNNEFGGMKWKCLRPNDRH